MDRSGGRGFVRGTALKNQALALISLGGSVLGTRDCVLLGSEFCSGSCNKERKVRGCRNLFPVPHSHWGLGPAEADHGRALLLHRARGRTLRLGLGRSLAVVLGRASGQGQEEETGRAGPLVWCGVTSGRGRRLGVGGGRRLFCVLDPCKSLGT